MKTQPSMVLFTNDRLISGFAAWCYLITFHYAGDAFDYLFEVCTNSHTEQQAADTARQACYLRRARGNFLRDVELETMH